MLCVRVHHTMPACSRFSRSSARAVKLQSLAGFDSGGGRGARHRSSAAIWSPGEAVPPLIVLLLAASRRTPEPGVLPGRAVSSQRSCFSNSVSRRLCFSVRSGLVSTAKGADTVREPPTPCSRCVGETREGDEDIAL